MLLLIWLISGVSLARCSWQDQRTVELVSAIFQGSRCRGTAVVFDLGSEKHFETGLGDDEMANDFVRQQLFPVTVIESEKISNHSNLAIEPICQNVVIFSQESSKHLDTFYNQIENQFFVYRTVIIVKSSSQEAKRITSSIARENVVLIFLNPGNGLQVLTWSPHKGVVSTAINKDTKINVADLLGRSINLSGLHIKVGTLHYPPYVLVDHQGKVHGIEPSILVTMSEYLKFTYEFVVSPPNEMWGEIFENNGNFTFTGLLGMLVRREVDFVSGFLYLSYTRLSFIDFTSVYKISYESFVVPAPTPYAKWTAVFYSFTISVWIWTIVSSCVIVVMLRLVASFSFSQRRRRDPIFANWTFCCHFVLGNLLTVQMQPHSVFSNANRMFLIWWFFGVLILTTGYRSGLISYMTFPFTPPPIDTIQQLVDSPLKKVIFSAFQKNMLMNSTSNLQKKLGQDLVAYYNLTEMYMLLGSGSVSVESSLDNLLYMAATMYPTTAAGPKVHLIKETIMPFPAAFGLQKDSQLKLYFDKVIQKLIESGIADYHKMGFAKQLSKWNPKKAKSELVPFSLDSLQGAFYLLTFGIVLSTLAFTSEVVCCPNKRHRALTVLDVGSSH